jgi:CBS-domain-containing membrane protein
VIAGAIATAVGGAVAKLMGDTPTGKVVATAVPVLIMGIAVFMILTELKIAPAIVQLTYIFLLGSVALGSALAFGLGGREVANRMLTSAYEKGQQNAGQVKADVQAGKQRGQEQAGRAQDAAQQKLDEGDNPAARRR